MPPADRFSLGFPTNLPQTCSFLDIMAHLTNVKNVHCKSKPEHSSNTCFGGEIWIKLNKQHTIHAPKYQHSAPSISSSPSILKHNNFVLFNLVRKNISAAEINVSYDITVRQNKITSEEIPSNHFQGMIFKHFHLEFY